MERIKQVILIRKDLKMRRGKEIAQGSHASMQFLTQKIMGQNNSTNNSTNNIDQSIAIQLSNIETAWLEKGMAKVCLRVDSEEQLLHFHEKAKIAGLNSALIQDSGRTEFHGDPTYTACAIGPDFVTAIDAITGDLTPY